MLFTRVHEDPGSSMKLCLLMKALLPTHSSCIALNGPFQSVRFESFFQIWETSLFIWWFLSLYFLSWILGFLGWFSLSLGLTFWKIGSPFPSRPYSVFYVSNHGFNFQELFFFNCSFPSSLGWGLERQSTLDCSEVTSQNYLRVPWICHLSWGARGSAFLIFPHSGFSALWSLCTLKIHLPQLYSPGPYSVSPREARGLGPGMWG